MLDVKFDNSILSFVWKNDQFFLCRCWKGGNLSFFDGN